jgi:hypothetical protein
VAAVSLGSWTPCMGGLAWLCRLTPLRRRGQPSLGSFSQHGNALRLCSSCGLGRWLRGGEPKESMESWEGGIMPLLWYMLLPCVERGGWRRVDKRCDGWREMDGGGWIRMRHGRTSRPRKECATARRALTSEPRVGSAGQAARQQQRRERARAVAMASLSLAGVAATTARPSSSGGRGRRLSVTSMATQKGGQRPTAKTVSSGTPRRSVSTRGTGASPVCLR